jgi:hypothetical protein
MRQKSTLKKVEPLDVKPVEKTEHKETEELRFCTPEKAA